MSSLRNDSDMSLRQKREQFANEIRRQKRKEIISGKRKLLMEQLSIIQLQNQSSQLSTLTFQQLLNLMQMNNQHEEQAIQQVMLKLLSPNENILYLISKIVESGKCSYLLQNLINRKSMMHTLQILSTIVSKPNLRHAQILVSKGIIEILLQILPIEQLTGIVANIIGNICIQSDDYCEIILQNYRHQLLISVFNTIYERFLHNELVQNPQKKLKYILWVLGVIIATRQSCLDFEQQYDCILQFCRQLMQRRIFISEAIQTVYELAVKNCHRVQEILYTVINQLIEEQTGQSQHLQNMLYLILKLSPTTHINYNKLFTLVYISEYKIVKHIIYIINKLEDSQKLNQLIKNQDWWERLLIKLDSNSQQFKITLTIIRRLRISYPCVWRFISQYIDDTYSKDTVLEIMIFLKNQLTHALEQNTPKSILLLQNINKYKITKSLNKIYLKQNYQYSSKAGQLIFLIESISKQIKNNYQIDVEI